MADYSSQSTADRVAALVQQLLRQRAIVRPITPTDDLRAMGLTSMDMVSLVLAVESEFALMIPESRITPANFRSVAAVSQLLSELRTPP
jgi:acyl carrier protein